MISKIKLWSFQRFTTNGVPTMVAKKVNRLLMGYREERYSHARSYTDKYQESANNSRDDTLQYFSRGLLATAEINIVKFLHLVDLERVLHDTMQHT